jgi:hypothetical protein
VIIVTKRSEAYASRDKVEASKRCGGWRQANGQNYFRYFLRPGASLYCLYFSYFSVPTHLNWKIFVDWNWAVPTPRHNFWITRTIKFIHFFTSHTHKIHPLTFLTHSIPPRTHNQIIRKSDIISTASLWNDLLFAQMRYARLRINKNKRQ